MTGTVTQTDAITRRETRLLIVEVFEETALVLGGLVAVHHVDDDFVWRFVKGLDAVCAKALRRIDQRDVNADADTADTESRLRPHPAIEDFLLKLRRS
jgi:hypothetical protein